MYFVHWFYCQEVCCVDTRLLLSKASPCVGTCTTTPVRTKGIVLPNITRSLFTIRSGNTDISNYSAEATLVMVPLKWGWNLHNGDCRDTHCTNGVDRG